MKNNGLVVFAFGAAIGSAVTWYLSKKFYEERSQAEIRSVKEVFARNAMKLAIREDADDQEQVPTPIEHLPEKPDLTEYAKQIRELGYTTYGTISEEHEDANQPEAEPPSGITGAKEGLTIENDLPYVISEDQFGEFDDYSKVSLTYYADHILADTDDRAIEDVEHTVGFESLNYFGEYDEDSVHVRNDRLKTDYEILLDQREYSEILQSKPYLRED